MYKIIESALTKLDFMLNKLAHIFWFRICLPKMHTVEARSVYSPHRHTCSCFRSFTSLRFALLPVVRLLFVYVFRWCDMYGNTIKYKIWKKEYSGGTIGSETFHFHAVVRFELRSTPLPLSSFALSYRLFVYSFFYCQPTPLLLTWRKKKSGSIEMCYLKEAMSTALTETDTKTI